MHPELIEWTCNRGENEFRLLEPEAIAVWWGYHKNKVNMNYEKFSRSLRYYYDKGILKKITGERYVYRFIIDPERMYKHIGISDCRPQIKPMPEDVRRTISKFTGKQNLEPSLLEDLLRAAPAPETPVALRPISHSLRSHLQSTNSSCVGSYYCGAKPRMSGSIERRSSFDAVYPTFSVTHSEDLPRMKSSVSVPDSFKCIAASQELCDSPTVLPVQSAREKFSTSRSSDSIQRLIGGHSHTNALQHQSIC